MNKYLIAKCHIGDGCLYFVIDNNINVVVYKSKSYLHCLNYLEIIKTTNDTSVKSHIYTNGYEDL